MNAARPLRIGVLDLTTAGWMGGLSYTHMIVQSLAQACKAGDAELFAFMAHGNQLPEGAPGVTELPVPTSRYGRPGRVLRRVLPLPDKSNLLWLAKKHQLSVVVPALGIPRFTFGTRSIGWIPDFQHVHLPHFFSAGERAGRDRQFADVAARCDAVILSSQDAYRDFVSFAPQARDKAHVMPFPSLVAFSPPSGNPLIAAQKYRLPEKFALVVNQFWAHKNHAIVVKALALLRDRNIRIPVVMTGLPNDPRDPQNATLSALMQQLAIAGLQDQVFILGRVPYADLVSLQRSTALLIQPSRFEGWNTSVQDLKALGRPMVCSDLAVHREQATDCLGFFECDDETKLATLLADVWPRLQAGPDGPTERRALAAEQEFARAHGDALLQLCRRVAFAGS
jgi:glycosyltransferase involved in cell wall biosynthesis